LGARHKDSARLSYVIATAERNPVGCLSAAIPFTRPALFVIIFM